MGKLVAAFACTHTLDPTHFPGEWKQAPQRVSRAVRYIGERLEQASPDVLVIVANDHYNTFSFSALPAFCVRIGDYVSPIKEQDMPAGIYDRFARLKIHDEFATDLLRAAIAEEFDLAHSWEGSVDHAFLEPLRFMELRRVPPLVPIWVNCLVAPQPTPARCFRFGEFLGRFVKKSPFKVAVLATGGMYHFPGLDFDRLAESHSDFDHRVLGYLTAGDNSRLRDIGIEELTSAGEHELLNWTVAAGTVGDAMAEILSYELCEGLAGIGAIAWKLQI